MEESKKKDLVQAIIGYVVFALASLSGFVFDFGIQVMGGVGLMLPLGWGWRTGEWERMGFTRRNLRPALFWGLGGGLLTAALGLLTIGGAKLLPDWQMMLAVGLPLAVMGSAFQEFFFRGWLQPRFGDLLGGWGGLLTTNLLFTLWHYLWPMTAGEGSAFPLFTLKGLLSTFASGLVYGWVFKRTENILAPLLAHGIALLTFVLVGAMVLDMGV